MRLIILYSVFLTLLHTTHVAMAQPRYQVTPLGTAEDYLWQAGDINERGEIAVRAGGDGVLYTNGQAVYTHNFAPISINDRGDMAGIGHTGVRIAATFTDGQQRLLGTLGGSESIAQGMNNSGFVAGYSKINDVVDHAFFFNGTTMVDLGTLGGTQSWAVDVNDRGQVTGRSQITGDTEAHAFIWHEGQWRDLGTLGGQSSEGFDINDAGHVAGTSSTQGGPEHAFLFNGTTMRDIGTLYGGPTAAQSLNDLDQVVGWSMKPGDLRPRAFLYERDHMYDLNDLIEPELGWTLWYAMGINESGVIVGFGRFNGAERSFVLTPIPEPAGITIAIVGIVFVGRRLPRATALSRSQSNS